MVICRQSVDGTPDEPYVIEPHSADQSDADLLLAKANGATAKGWSVEWHGPTSFTASKGRWGGTECSRYFWIE
jgi:hypothetical protein